ncbi:DoxX family protein [Bosea sp. 2KB_26]|uniref:DoxX family protein n=1 Tax=Bosea sp. 2KB_26 TaxID=3237475 RepID=UPI003F93301E
MPIRAPSSSSDRASPEVETHHSGYLLARMLLAGAFIFSGVSKLFDFGGAVQEMTHNGLPLPTLMAVAVIGTQLGGSALLIWQRTSWIGAGLLAGFTAMATLIAHAPWNDAGPIPLPQSVILLQNAGLFGGILLALAMGGGRRQIRILLGRLRSR